MKTQKKAETRARTNCEMMAEGLNWWKFLSDTVAKGWEGGRQRGECLIFHCQSNLIQARLKFSESEWTNRAHYGHRGSANEIKQPIDQFACQQHTLQRTQDVPDNPSHFSSFSTTTILSPNNALIQKISVDKLRPFEEYGVWKRNQTTH